VIRLMPAMAGIPFLLTTSNKVALEGLVGPTDAYQIIGKPEDLNYLLRAIDSAVLKPSV